MAHTALLDRKYRQLVEANHSVSIEGQNKFTLKGSYATLGGKPDLIGLNGSGTIYDVKTGQPKPSDHAQVMVYMWAVPRALTKYKGLRFDGLVVYPDHEVRISAEAVDATFVENLAGLIKRVSAEAPARRVPSADECRFCDLTSKSCAERVEMKSEEMLTTAEF